MEMARTSTWSGWIVFGGWLMLIIGAVTSFEGLIAIIRDKYYVFGPEQVIVFDVTTWGWVMLFWGLVLACAGIALAVGKSWARWFTLVVASLNFIAQLGFLGSSQHPLWALTTLSLSFIVIYALIVHWEEARERY
jgi:hypothetical protein